MPLFFNFYAELVGKNSLVRVTNLAHAFGIDSLAVMIMPVQDGRTTFGPA